MGQDLSFASTCRRYILQYKLETFIYSPNQIYYMNLKKLFNLNLTTIIIDIVILIIGAYIRISYKLSCSCLETQCNCPQSFLYYLGIILMIIAIAHFLFVLLAFILNKNKK